jgi:hypothetical protein
MHLPSQQSSLCKQALRSFANILCKMEFVFIGSEKRITSNRSPDEVSGQWDILPTPLHLFFYCHTGAFPIRSLYVYLLTVNVRSYNQCRTARITTRHSTSL